ncbi:MAG TPA: hypothetical protein VN914_08615 [Polyangia bacterium]|nr:hypothetical protein [Polyangia bacterium]
MRNHLTWLVVAVLGCGSSGGGNALVGGSGGSIVTGGSGGSTGGTAGFTGGSGGTTFDAGPDVGATGGAADGGGGAPDANTGGAGGTFQKLVWRNEPGPGYNRAIGGSGENDVWVVGDLGEIWNSKGDGVWTRRPADTMDRMNGVWGTGPNDVYVAPNINYILHWKGMWVKETSGIPLAVVFHQFWGAAPDDVYVAGGGLMHTTGNGAWTAVNIPPGTNGIGNVHGYGKDVWGLGLSGLVIHSKGDGKWLSEDPGLMSNPLGIWAASADEVYVLGSSEVFHRRSDGKWTKEAIALDAATGGLSSIWGSGPKDIYVTASRGFFFHSNGDGAWSREAITTNPNVPIASVWGTSAQNVYILAGVGVLHGKPQ